ncbi:sensor histidine kinase [Nonomuraea maritima]|uniref:sensor histidine kinase n=1 Tax=Nonomuraea maritima TaxID=683260 RepID=UPI003715FD30
MRARAAYGLLNWRSLRWKIATLVGLACCAVAVAIGVLVHSSTYDRTMELGRSRAFEALASLPEDGTQDIAASDPVPSELLRQLGGPDARADRAVYWFDDRRPDHPWMWGATRVGGRELVVQMWMGGEMASLRALDRHIVLASLGTLAVIVPLTALVAEPPTRRLRRVARTARRIADGELDARIGGRPRGGDEIDEISRAVDSMAEGLQRRLLSEQRFTADVAHELRTPLMGLITSAELLAEGEATDLVRDRVRVLRALVEDLLEISRLDAGAERPDLRPVPLADVVEASVARTGLLVRFTAAGGAVAETDPRRLDRILANLVVNAHRHGVAPVDVAVSGTTVVVRDHGPGFPADLLAEGPQRFRTGAAERGHGHGLGLTIAMGQARVIGATLTLSNAANGGAVATLGLPPATDPS